MSDLYSSIFNGFAFSQARQLLAQTLDLQGLSLGSIDSGQKDRKTEEECRHDRQAREHLVWLQAQASERDIVAINDRIDRVMQAAITQEREAREAMEDMLARAPKINGKAVFRTSDGKRVFFEDGTDLPASQQTQIDWSRYQNAAPGEDWLAVKNNAEKAVQTQLRAADWKERAENPTNGDLEAIGGDIDQLLDENPELNIAPDASAANQAPVAVSRSGMTAPADLTPCFCAAHDPSKPDHPKPQPQITAGNDFASLPDGP